MTPSENKILRKIKTWIGEDPKPYSFWFVYGKDGKAESWEGGYNMYMGNEFRNQYTITADKKIVKNWE